MLSAIMCGVAVKSSATTQPVIYGTAIPRPSMPIVGGSSLWQSNWTWWFHMTSYEFHMLPCDVHWFWLPSRRGWFFRQSLKFSWATNAHESKENPNNIQQSYQAKPRKSTLFFKRFPWKESKDRPIQEQIAHHMTSGRIPPNKLAGQDGKTQAGFKIRSFYWDKIGW